MAKQKKKKEEKSRQPKNGKPPVLRVVGWTDPAKKKKPKALKEFVPAERAYFRELHAIVDEVYAMSDTDCGWTWSQLADHAGLAYQTVANLGDRKTLRPQFRTVWRLCKAVGMDLVLKKSKGRQIPLAVKTA